MHIESESSFDVVVVGGGIAGCCAAIEAARAGASVCLASASGVFSGSSFYPGTWGLGLVGPRDAADIDDMVETILHVGRGAANAALVDSFVRGIPEAIAALEAMGVSLKRPANPDGRNTFPASTIRCACGAGLNAIRWSAVSAGPFAKGELFASTGASCSISPWMVDVRAARCSSTVRSNAFARCRVGQSCSREAAWPGFTSAAFLLRAIPQRFRQLPCAVALAW